ncbi:hypothetical protein CNR37_00171 [Pseudomonas phage ventosus]|uniref:Tail fiber protein n=1 Tax=Pseudomonas phage ventosus TaxID=2048980 RepID=A0A2H4P879_9CAUD|nr:hypothetical protein CNR37_00171 [Pseudomonas phage ventosus]
MVDIIKQDMTDIWAVAGDVVAPDSAKVRAGWGVEAVPRQWWNWFENRQDSNIAYMLQKGIPEWDQFTEYLTNKSYVQRNNIVYKCILTGVNKDPATTPANWVKAFPESSAYLETIRPLAVSNNSMAFIDGTGTAQNTPSTAYGRSVLNVADAAAARTLTGSQQANSNLTALSAVAASTNALPYFTGTSTMGTTVLTQAARDILAGVDYAAIRATLQLTSAATTQLQANALERDISKIMRVGAFGLGSFLDLRTHVYATGVPSDCFSAGTVFGLVNGGVGGLEIPGLSGTWYGVLQVNGHSVDGTAIGAVSRVFITNNGRVFSQAAASASAWGTWAESWTNSNLVKTASATDNTAGRMLKVGDFGIGSQGVLVGDINALSNTGTGFYLLGIPFTGSPIAGSAATVIHQALDNERTQIATTSGTAVRTFIRKYASGAWQPWAEIYNSSNTQAIVDQVTLGIQPTLDAKLDKAGGTMTGQLLVPSVELGSKTAASTPFLDFNSSGLGVDYDARIFGSNGTSTTGNGRLNYTAAGHTFTGLITGTITTAQGLTGNINISQVNSLQASLDGKMPTGGGAYTPTLHAVRAVSTMDAGIGQGVIMGWNESGTGAAAFINNQGGGSGGFVFRNVNVSNTVETGRVTFGGTGGITCVGLTSNGDIYATSSVISANHLYAGGANGARFHSDGNVWGSVWGGYLSNWMFANLVYKSTLQSDTVNQVPNGAIGSYAFCYTQVGATNGQQVGSGNLLYGFAAGQGGQNPPGTWRCMGDVSAGQRTLFQRVA